jgi:hypothetical protein
VDETMSANLSTETPVAVLSTDASELHGRRISDAAASLMREGRRGDGGRRARTLQG